MASEACHVCGGNVARGEHAAWCATHILSERVDDLEAKNAELRARLNQAVWAAVVAAYWVEFRCDYQHPDSADRHRRTIQAAMREADRCLDTLEGAEDESPGDPTEHDRGE